MNDDELVEALCRLVRSVRFDAMTGDPLYAYVEGQRVDLRELWLTHGDDGAWARGRWREIVLQIPNAYP